MSDEGPREMVDGISHVAVTAANSSGVGLRQMLLTVLAPTLALLGIAVGVWDSGKKEESARRRDEDLRTSALVLPYYDTVVTAQDAVDLSIEECDNDFESYLVAEIGSPEEKAAEIAFTESCAKVTSDFHELGSALNRAILVSDKDLEPVVVEYQKAQQNFENIYFGTPSWERCVLEDSEDPDLQELNDDKYFECVDEAEQADLTAREEASTELDNVRERLTNVVQAQVLLDRVQSP